MNFCDGILSKDDCAIIIRQDVKLSRNASINILKYEIKKLPGHPGYLGQYFFITIHFQAESNVVESRQYFAKSLPYHDAVLKTAVEEWGIFRKEADLYSKIFQSYERKPIDEMKWAPECFLARSDLIVMEDLTKSGFRAMPFQTPFNDAHMKLVFDRLAQMHACSIQFEIEHLEGKSIGSLFNDEILFETTFTPKSGWFVAGLKGIYAIALNRLANDASQRSAIKDQLWSVLEQSYTLVKCTNQFRSVIVHRDLWFNNILFKFAEKDDHFTNPIDCVLVDFQLARYLPPAFDFMCALYQLTNRVQRKCSTDSYIEYYYESLQRKLISFGLNGRSILSRKEFERSLKYYRIVGLIWAGVLQGFVNFPTGVLDQLHESDPDTYTRISMENRDDFILKYYDCDRFYRETMDDIVTEILEYLVDK
ncbi:uncharacterized protein LOC131282856 [Anopheles ziemanni]|uniref:uncharacterized protein LOC131263296 n=1 Tax=Anopheles coustani TaxID=139045 RepID=UPI00265AA889|nr:uncharacterized protein LOC131263296 [Anopheles coustani]XP_058168383.1 uncharacterized protein LOC131282856 [Anopheles ziemanni]